MTIGPHELSQMFQAASARIREQHTVLSELDSVAGDGDHGTTMLRIASQLAAAGESSSPKAILHDTGWKILGVDGGASSSLLGTFFLGMADAPECEGPLDSAGLAAAFESGMVALSNQTRADLGDKTLIDALLPAIGALRTAAQVRKTPVEALHDAAQAARAGAESTSKLAARFGRAKFLGEKTIGHQDPGAVSVALLFEGFSMALTESKGDKVNA
jgi:dihydroxyacetone kinase-like protein